MPATAQLPGNLRDRHATFGENLRLPLLLRRELGASAAVATAGSCCSNPRHDAFVDQRSLILRECRKHMQEQLAVRGGRVELKSCECLEANLPLREVLGNLNEMLGIASQPIQFPDDERIASTTSP